MLGHCIAPKLIPRSIRTRKAGHVHYSVPTAMSRPQDEFDELARRCLATARRVTAPNPTAKRTSKCCSREEPAAHQQWKATTALPDRTRNVRRLSTHWLLMLSRCSFWPAPHLKHIHKAHNVQGACLRFHQRTQDIFATIHMDRENRTCTLQFSHCVVQTARRIR